VDAHKDFLTSYNMGGPNLNTKDRGDYFLKIGVIIFCSVQFLPEKTTKLKKKRLETEPEPAQTGRFWFGFGPVFWIKYWTNLYAFFGLFNGLLMDFCWAYN